MIIFSAQPFLKLNVKNILLVCYFSTRLFLNSYLKKYLYYHIVTVTEDNL